MPYLEVWGADTKQKAVKKASVNVDLKVRCEFDLEVLRCGVLSQKQLSC